MLKNLVLKKLLFIVLIPAFTFSMDNEDPGEHRDMPPEIRAEFQGMTVGRLARQLTDTTNVGWVQGIWVADTISRRQQGWVDWGIHILPAAIGMVWGYTYRDRHTTDTVDEPTPEKEGSE